MRILITSVLIALAASCGSGEPSKDPSSVIAAAPATRYPHLCTDEVDGVPDISQVQIKLERTACYGWCPAYTITLNGDGHGVFVGSDCVLLEQTIEFSFDPQLVRDLLDRFDALDFFEMEHEDNWIVVDAPSDIFTLKIGDRSQTFENASWEGFPEDDKHDFAFHNSLYRLSLLIDNGVEVEQWIGTESDRAREFADKR